ncbi:MAG: DUF1648 domain-containing protein [Phycisphaerales bacterium]|nr:DUF1648 domain-containing protein [Phycisphaerales bacterium]
MKQKAKPRVHPPPSRIGRALNIASILCLAAGFVLCIVFWGRLPDRIPIHFNAAGEADGWGARGMIWLLPVISTVLVPGMLVLQRFPWLSNVPVAVNAENAIYQYRLVNRLLAVLSLAVSVVFLAILIETLMVALGEGSLLGGWMLPVLLAPTVGALGWYLISAFRRPARVAPGDSSDADQLSSDP